MALFSFGKKQDNLPPLRFFNTLTGTQEVFEPLSGREVKMYNCGPTVYDYVHIGNLRSYVFADTIRRVLDHWGYSVKQVINITDFGHLVSDGDEGEDKMTKGLKREGMALTLPNMRTLAERYTESFISDLEAMGVRTKNITFPRASDYIPEQVALIQTLEQKGYAYRTKDGVYFDTEKFPNYGKLGAINLKGQQGGARLEQNPEKKNPHDFVLWKSDKKLGWESPWGLGFPGWHIECTAMIFKLLGKQIDIHTGGIDHIPIHHNNEIAQAEAVTGKQFARYWMHGEFITIEDKRVGKSVGNAILLRSLVDRGVSARALRYWYLGAHYRTPMNFTWDAVEGANAALLRLTRYFFEETAYTGEEPDPVFMKDFHDYIADDLNTARALARVWDLVKDEGVSVGIKHASLVEADKILGLGFTQTRVVSKLKVAHEGLPENIQQLLKDREAARTSKDFTAADDLRQKIEAAGYTLTDSSEGQKLEKK